MVKPIFTYEQAAAQLIRNLEPSYLPSGADGLTLTYAYRATATIPQAPAGVTDWIGGLYNSMGGFQPLNESQITVMERTLDMIEEIANVRFVRVGTGTSGPGAFSDSAELLIGTYTTGRAVGLGGAADYAFAIDNTGKYYRAAKVWIDGTDPLLINSSSLSKAAYLFPHEVMHALGIRHPGDYDIFDGPTNYEDDAIFFQDSYQYSLMSYFDESNTGADWGDVTPRTPMLYDIAALQKIYGANISTRTGDTVYGYNSNAGYDAFNFPGPTARRAFTIWDAGGIDTLNLSGLQTSAVIDLREESFSSAGVRADGGPMINNIAIARGAIIENATGGGGNDTITGNATGNFLRGNRGDDIISGLGGNDTAGYAGVKGEYTILRNLDGSYVVIDSVAGRDGTDTIVGVENLRFIDQTVSLIVELPFPALFAVNLSQGKAIAAAYQILLGGTPGIAGFEFLIKGNLSTNFGAGAGPVFNDENIFINVANSLVQGNPIASAQFNSLASGATLAEQVASLYAKIIPLAKQTADGLAYLTRPDGLKFYEDVAKERGITAENGPAVVAMASLLKVAVDGKNGIGNPISDLIASIADGSSELPATSQSVLPIETIDGTKFDADDAPDVMPGFSGPTPAPVPLVGVDIAYLDMLAGA